MVYGIQHIRAIAAVLIVMTHVHDILNRAGCGSAGIVTPACGSAAPDLFEINIFFTFAAGFLFQHLSVTEDFGPFIRRRMRNVLVPYVIISLPVICYDMISHGGASNPGLSTVPDVLMPFYLLLTGLHLGPLWFIPMIFVIYFATPALKLIDRSLLRYVAFLVLSFTLANTVFPRPASNDNPIMAALHYVPIFVLGMFLSRCQTACSALVRNPAVMGLALSGLAMSVIFSTLIIVENQYMNKTVMLVSLFFVAIRLQHMRIPLVDVLANCSFGIFFLHGYLVAILRILGERGVIVLDYSALTLAVTTLAVLAACMVLIWKIKILAGPNSRYIIGV